MTYPFPPCDQPMPDDGPKVIPAATLVVFRKGAQGEGAPELLFVQRASTMRFAGGATVFPGGRVDPADRELARQLNLDTPLEMTTARVAAIRETLEETGLALGIGQNPSAEEARAARALLLEDGRLAPVLERMGWTLAPERLTFFAHWCPPWDGAFDTRFFVTDLGTGAVDVTVDATENTRLFWASAQGALDMAAREEIGLIFPTRRNLERLAHYGSHAATLAALRHIAPQRISPRIEQRPEGEFLVIPADQGYPVLEEPRETARRG